MGGSDPRPHRVRMTRSRTTAEPREPAAVTLPPTAWTSPTPGLRRAERVTARVLGSPDLGRYGALPSIVELHTVGSASRRATE